MSLSVYISATCYRFHVQRFKRHFVNCSKRSKLLEIRLESSCYLSLTPCMPITVRVVTHLEVINVRMIKITRYLLPMNNFHFSWNCSRDILR